MSGNWLSTILLLSIAATHCTVSLADVKVPTDIHMVFGGEFPPYYEEGLEQGMFIELLEAFEQQHPQFNVVVHVLARKRIDHWLVEQRADAFSLTSTDFMPKQAKPHYVPSNVIWRTFDIVVSSSTRRLVYQEDASLFGKKVGVIIGNHYKHLEGHFSADRILRMDVYSVKSLFDILLAEHVDAIIVNRHSIPHYMDSYHFEPEDFYLNPKPLYFFELTTMVHRRHRDFHQAISAFIVWARHTGLLAEIEQKYGFARVSRE